MAAVAVEAEETLEDVLLATLNHYTVAFESRIHNTLYLSELRKLEENEEFNRLAPCYFRLYFEGANSEEIHYTLQDLLEEERVKTDTMSIRKPGKPRPEKKTVFESINTDYDISKENEEIIEEVCEEYRHKHLTDLVDDVKRTWPMIENDFDEVIELEEYHGERAIPLP